MKAVIHSWYGSFGYCYSDDGLEVFLHRKQIDGAQGVCVGVVVEGLHENNNAKPRFCSGRVVEHGRADLIEQWRVLHDRRIAKVKFGSPEWDEFHNNTHMSREAIAEIDDEEYPNMFLFTHSVIHLVRCPFCMEALNKALSERSCDCESSITNASVLVKGALGGELWPDQHNQKINPRRGLDPRVTRNYHMMIRAGTALLVAERLGRLCWAKYTVPYVSGLLGSQVSADDITVEALRGCLRKALDSDVSVIFPERVVKIRQELYGAAQ